MLKPRSILRVLSTTSVAIARLKKMIAEQRALQLNAVRRYEVSCSECHASFPLHRWAFIQDRYHVPPSGCTEGDYWVDSLFEHCHLVCPECNGRNRINFREDMKPLLEIRRKHYFSDKELFDPPIVVEAERQSF